MKKKVIVDVATYLLVLLFVYTATSKLLNFGSFRLQLERQPLTMHFAQLLAFTIPLLELMIAVFLVIPKLRKWGLHASLYLMTLFTMYVGYMLAVYPKSKLPCSCGGIIKAMNWEQHLVFNSFFTLLALTGLWIYQKMHNRGDSDLDKLNYV
jgi:uncharacterized membrane protein YphA (DoxX/SURF4 family)